MVLLSKDLLVNRCFQVLQSFFESIRNEIDKKEKVHSICKLVTVLTKKAKPVQKSAKL